LKEQVIRQKGKRRRCRMEKYIGLSRAKFVESVEPSIINREYRTPYKIATTVSGSFKVSEREEMDFLHGLFEEASKQYLEEILKFYKEIDNKLVEYIKNNNLDNYSYLEAYRLSAGGLGRELSISEISDAVHQYCEYKNYEVYTYKVYTLEQVYSVEGQPDIKSYEYFVFLYSNNLESKLPINTIKYYL
jgi:hypothetical protein